MCITTTGVQDACKLALGVPGAVGVGELWFGYYGGWSCPQVSHMSCNWVSKQVGLWVGGVGWMAHEDASLGLGGGASVDAQQVQ